MLKCECGRTFKRAPHLGRHQSATGHGHGRTTDGVRADVLRAIKHEERALVRRLDALRALRLAMA